MTLYDFNTLNEHTKYEVVFHNGIFLDVVLQGNERFALYAIDMFFVEVTYDNMSNQILGCRSFITGQLLDKFSRLKI